jgi:6-phosphogluconate dehydrogenase
MLHRHGLILCESSNAVSKVSEARFCNFESDRRGAPAKAVYSRSVSAMKPQRLEVAKVFKPSNPKFSGDRKQWVADIRKALYASKISSCTQGYMLMRAAAKQYGWNLNNGGIALMWRGGFIIRSAFLGDIKKAFDKNPNLDNLLLDPFFKKAIKGCTRSWRKVVSTAVRIAYQLDRADVVCS